MKVKVFTIHPNALLTPELCAVLDVIATGYGNPEMRVTGDGIVIVKDNYSRLIK